MGQVSFTRWFPELFIVYDTDRSLVERKDFIQEATAMQLKRNAVPRTQMLYRGNDPWLAFAIVRRKTPRRIANAIHTATWAPLARLVDKPLADGQLCSATRHP